LRESSIEKVDIGDNNKTTTTTTTTTNTGTRDDSSSSKNAQISNIIKLHGVQPFM
jgi:hypothetical protein